MMALLSGCLTSPVPQDPSTSVFSTANRFRHAPGVIGHLECKICHEKERPITTPPHGAGADCKGCHNPAGWLLGFGTFDHTRVLDQACSTCHEKDRPIETPPHGGGGDCKSCHMPGGGWLTGVTDPHNPVPSQCNSCHGPQGNKNHLPAVHISTMAKDCKSCHMATIGEFKSWSGGFYDHEPEPGNCTLCHGTGQAKVSIKAGHIPTLGLDCKGCHLASIPTYSDWKGGMQNHSPTPKNCGVCHDLGATKNSFPDKHIATSGQDCVSCHQASVTNNYPKVDGWKGGKFNHVPQPASCSSCHDTGGIHDSIKSKPGHIPTLGIDCIACHQASLATLSLPTKNWKGGIQNHTPTPQTCAVCHGVGQTKNHFPALHIPTFGKDCKVCHLVTTTTGYKDWKKGVYGHNPVPTTCAQCHSAGGAHPSYPAKHIPTGGKDCVSCHQGSVTNKYLNWKTGVFDHVPAPATCNTCHDDSGAHDSFPPSANVPNVTSHMATNGLDCKSCHQASVTSKYLDWKGGLFSHVPEPANCSSCHSATGSHPSLTPDHIAIGTQDCKVCHQATLATLPTTNKNWKNPIYNHNPAPVTCAGCHGAGKANADFPAVHVPVGTSDCKACHLASVTNNYPKVNGWKGGQYPHPANLSACANCHGDGGLHDSFPPSANIPNVTSHIAINGQDCKTCHNASVTGGFKDWSGATFAHTSAMITGKNCSSCHAADRPVTGRLMAQDPALKATNGHYGKFDCYFCHKTTLGFKDWNSSSTSHYNAAGTKIESCLPCHYASEKPVFDQVRPVGTSHVEHGTSLTYWGSYNINAVGNQPGANGMLGVCYRCHNVARRSFAE